MNELPIKHVNFEDTDRLTLHSKTSIINRFEFLATKCGINYNRNELEQHKQNLNSPLSGELFLFAYNYGIFRHDLPNIGDSHPYARINCSHIDCLISTYLGDPIIGGEGDVVYELHQIQPRVYQYGHADGQDVVEPGMFVNKQAAFRSFLFNLSSDRELLRIFFLMNRKQILGD